MSDFNTGVESVLFDLDGTLIDTADDLIQVLNVMIAEENAAPVPAQQIWQRVSDGARGLIRLAFRLDEGQEGYDRLRSRLLDLYYEQLLQTRSRVFPGLEQLLEKLEDHGIPWGIVTNKPALYSKRLLDQLDLARRCSILVCPDHVSLRKPHPESLLLACEKLACNPERTVYVGDHIRDMQAARNAELIAVAAAWGYLGEEDRIEEWYPDFILKQPRDLEKLLGTLRFA